MPAPRLAAVSFDLTRLHPRTVTSFYSNLVTRPTGRAVRVGLEQQLSEATNDGPCISVLDFSQVRVMDFSCADEIVAKLLMRYAAPDRPADTYFVARGLHEHHLEAVEAVLERHDLLMVAEYEAGDARLLGRSDPWERDCWSIMLGHRRVRVEEIAASAGLMTERVAATFRRFIATRVAVPLAGDAVCALPRLGHE
jgi:hypothetical protein